MYVTKIPTCTYLKSMNEVHTCVPQVKPPEPLKADRLSFLPYSSIYPAGLGRDSSHVIWESSTGLYTCLYIRRELAVESIHTCGRGSLRDSTN